ncbi:MAG: DNA polymerase I [Sandaracinus sp.]
MRKGDKLVLVDGSWLVFRAFFALPATLSTKAGLPTNATFGFATMFRKLFAGRAPDYGAVVFDTPEPTHREIAFPAYKAQRPPMHGDLRSQLPYVDRVVAANHFPILRAPGWEADDVIATLAKRGADAGMEVVIVAGDKDLAQRVGERVRMQDTMRDVTYDAELVRKKWGVPPDKIPDWLALVGDTVDNIPGVPGIGDKGAAALLEKYGSVEGVLASLGELKGKQRAALEAEKDNVLLYKKLATVSCEAAIEVDIDALAITPPDPGELDALYRELEFYSLLTGGGASEKSEDTRSVACEAVHLDGAVQAWLAAVPAGKPIAIHVLRGPDTVHGRVPGYALAWEPGKALFVDVRGEGLSGAHASLGSIAAMLRDPSRPKVVHDVKRLYECVGSEQALAGPVLDTMLASYLVDPTKVIPHRLEQVSKEYVQRWLPPLKAIVGSGQSEKKLEDVAAEELAAHAGEHADVVRAVAEVLGPKLDEVGLRSLYEETERPLAGVLARMEIAGIYVDREDLGKLGVELRVRKAEIEQRIYALAGHELNIGSTKQLAEVLFEELKLPVIKKNKTGYSTDAEVLERLAPKHPIAAEVLAHRELAKLINTYTDVLAASISERTGRIHASFQQTTGASGRLISTDPDLQRTPVRTPEGKRIRRAFVAPPGTRMIAADWSQIELRVLAHFSGDARLKEAFEKNLDLHRRTAALLFSVEPEAVTPEQRNVGKTVNFATIYGQGATALGQILGIPRKDAQRYIEQYFEAYAGVRAWLDRTIEEAHAKGYVTTLVGRRRYIPELSMRNDTDRSAGERMAANTPIQGSAADLCKLAMLAIDRRFAREGLRTRMLLQVHDELVFEAPEAEVEAASRIVRECMEKPCPLDVPLVVSIGVGASWGEAK